MLRKHRDRSEIMNDILDTANGGGATRARIMQKANLTYTQMKEHVSILTEKNLLNYERDTQMYKTTEKGLMLLNAYAILGELINTTAVVAASPQQYLF